MVEFKIKPVWIKGSQVFEVWAKRPRIRVEAFDWAFVREFKSQADAVGYCSREAAPKEAKIKI